ncbi:MAG: hypothetical protein JXR58_08910 [Bacteroidales bacterium]|nr:hypothetical protein [Bacteroidales bacterium]
MKTAIILLATMIFYSTSCKKPRYDYCTWPSETTSMINYINFNINDTCKYDSLRISLKFNTKYLGEWPPCGTFNDSVIGKIESLTVIAHYYDNTDTILDTINNIINFEINYYNGEDLEGSLNYLNAYSPLCNTYIFLTLSAPTDTTCLQFFKIDYKETDGTIYSTTTNPVYVIP